MGLSPLPVRTCNRTGRRTDTMWKNITVRAGQSLSMTFAKKGTRTYIAVAGGIANDMWLNSRSTFHKAGVGGMEGRAIQEGQTVPVGKGRAVSEGREVKEDCRPVFAADRRWEVEVVRGPNDDWVDDAGHQMFLSTDWKLSAKSDRTGFRLEGPQWTFTEKAHNKLPEHGTEPSPTLLTKGILVVQSILPVKRQLFWSTTAPAWAVSSILTLCPSARFGNSDSPDRAIFTISRKSVWKPHKTWRAE